MVKMRKKQTADEVFSLELLEAEVKGEGWAIDAQWRGDRPDAAFDHTGAGRRAGVEVTMVGHAQWHKWHRSKGGQLDVDELDVTTIPREADEWLRLAVRDKAEKCSEYLNEVGGNEVWLLLNGGERKDFDFFVLDDDEGYDIPLLVRQAAKDSGPFARIFVASVSGDRIVQVFPWAGDVPVAPDLSVPSNLKRLSVKSIQAQLGLGVAKVNLDQEPSRFRVAPPLVKGRGKESELKKLTAQEMITNSRTKKET